MCETIQRYSGEYKMRFKLPVMLNIQLEFVFYTWGNAPSLWVPLFCHHEKKNSLETLSWVLWVPILVHPSDGNLTQNRDPRVGKLTFENLKMSKHKTRHTVATTMNSLRNRKLFCCICIAWYKHERGWENLRQLCKP